MDKIDHFLQNFTKQSISTSALAKECGLKREVVEEYLKSTPLDLFSKKWQYYKNGKNITSEPLAHLKDGVERKVVALHNRYFINRIKKAEITFATELQGLTICKGEVEDDNIGIGGVYRNAWTLWTNYGQEMTSYSKLSLPETLALAPKEIFDIHFEKGKYSLSLPVYNIKTKSNIDFFTSFVNALLKLKEQEDLFVYHHFDAFDLVHQEAGEEVYPFYVSYIMREEHLSQYEQCHQEEDLVLRKVKL